MDVDSLVGAIIDREGGYVNHPADAGGPTCFGITEAVARASGYSGPMRQLPRDEAAAIYKRLYWLRPRLDEVAKRSPAVAAELFDTGVNMGPA
ncbi:MAG TPA: glycosyl hydrolase 108 family protein, partial [Sphingomicrobium sp.]